MCQRVRVACCGGRLVTLFPFRRLVTPGHARTPSAAQREPRRHEGRPRRTQTRWQPRRRPLLRAPPVEPECRGVVLSTRVAAVASRRGGHRGVAQQGAGVVEYVADVQAASNAFVEKGVLWDHDSTIRNLRRALTVKKGSFVLVLGGADVGKSLLLSKLARELNDSGKHAVVIVDGRGTVSNVPQGIVDEVNSDPRCPAGSVMRLRVSWRDALASATRASPSQLRRHLR